MDNIRTGALIRRLRRELGLTQLQLAGRLGVSDKAVSKWERGVSQTQGYYGITCVYLLANKRIMILS